MAIRTEAQKRALIKDMQKWPKGLKELNALTVKALCHLKAKGHSDSAATNMVIEILKECAEDIKQGHYGLVSELLEMTLLDKDLNGINIDKILNDF